MAFKDPTPLVDRKMADVRIAGQRLALRYKNLLVILVSIAVAWVILTSPHLHAFTAGLGAYGYAGMYVAGALFSYAFTAVPAMAIIALLAQTSNPLILAIIGGAGAMTSDYVLFSFVRKRVLREAKRVERKLPAWVRRVRASPSVRFLHALTPLFAGLIIASPLPDELAVVLLSSSRITVRRFLLFSFIFNTIGILVIAIGGRLL